MVIIKKKKIIEVSKVFIDKISILLAVDKDSEKKMIEERFMLRVTDFGQLSYINNFSLSARLFSDKEYGSSIVIQCKPTREGYRFFRVEFNPEKIYLNELICHINYILPGGFKSLIDSGFVTRCDVAIDAFNFDINDCVIHVKHKQVVGVFHGNKFPMVDNKKHFVESKKGSIQTMVFGKGGWGTIQFKVYDKSVQVKEKEKNPYIKNKYRDKKCTRFEVVIRKEVPVKGLCSIANPFLSMSVSDYSSLNCLGEWSSIFIEACRYSGLKKNMNNLSVNNARKVKKSLQINNKNWWNPDEFWKGWGQAVEKALTPIL